MVQQFDSREAREAVASEQLATQLEALSRPLAERVLGRAIEIQHEAEATEAAEAARIDYDDLRSIAMEVGISEDALKRALLEELDTERDHGASTIERLTAPEHIRGGTVVDGDRTEIERRLRNYLERVEGLQLTSRDSTHLAWSNRRHGRRGDWVMESVTTDQRTAGKHLVELDFNTGAGRKRARRLALIAVILGTIFGGAIGGLAVFGGVALGIAAGVAGAVSWVRRLTRSARRSINGALDAVNGRSGESGPDRTWLDIWESQQRR